MKRVRRIAPALLLAAISIAWVACDRVVDLTPDASTNGIPDAAISTDDDAHVEVPDASTFVPDAGPDAGSGGLDAAAVAVESE
jgi:hypothetical protein